MRIIAWKNRKKQRRFALLLLCSGLLTLLLSCAHKSETPAEQSPTPSVFKHVDPVEAAAIIDRNKRTGRLVILDFRAPEDFRKRRIEGAVNIYYYSEGFRTALEALDKDKIYIIYCRTGKRSGEALAVMKGLGFRSVFHITGGMERWLADDLPLVP